MSSICSQKLASTTACNVAESMPAMKPAKSAPIGSQPLRSVSTTLIFSCPQQTAPDGEPFTVSPTVQYGLPLLLVIILPLLIALVQWLTPGFAVGQRTHDMDRKLPFAASYVAAMAAANATPSVIFKSLARNEAIYGEISKDAAWIYHSIEFMGRDLVTTLKEGVDRSPSERFAEFLQGIVGTLTSGGNLKLYFLNRSEYYA